jgi:hypothetical protein
MNAKPKACFVIMPISTPSQAADTYKGDQEHFRHVLDHLFIPSIKAAGFEPIPPKATGSDLIQAEIIKNLSQADLVLCDMSNLNPNVFFEFGIRTALDKPVALVVDDKTMQIPFDTSIIQFHRYRGALDVWHIEEEIKQLVEHLRTSCERSNNRNSLWKYFGIALAGTFKPEEATVADKLDLVLSEVTALKAQRQESGVRPTTPDQAAAIFVEEVMQEQRKKKVQQDREIAEMIRSVLADIRRGQKGQQGTGG